MRVLSTCLLALLAMPSCVGESDAPWRLTPAPGSPLAGPLKVNALGMADFNGDGRPDLAAVNGDPGELFILMNQGDGRFAPPALGGRGRTLIGATASGLLIADLNNDNAPDIVVCYHDRDEIGVLLSQGDGAFKPPNLQRVMTRAQGSPHVHNLALGDINQDRHLDVLVAQADDNAIVWALGDGAGRFTPGTQAFAAGNHPYTIVVADFNGDGKLDFASPNAESHDLTVGLGDGAGGFAAPTGNRPSLPRQTLSLAAGDVNGDGIVDLIANSDVQQSELALLLGDGAGGFTRSEHLFSAPARCYGQIIADVNGDGLTDVAAPCIDRASVIVWLAEDAAALRFQRMEFATPGTDSQVLAIGDVNGDGVADAVTAGWEKPTLTILLGERLTPPSSGVDAH